VRTIFHFFVFVLIFTLYIHPFSAPLNLQTVDTTALYKSFIIIIIIVITRLCGLSISFWNTFKIVQ